MDRRLGVCGMCVRLSSASLVVCAAIAFPTACGRQEEQPTRPERQVSTTTASEPSFAAVPPRLLDSVRAAGEDWLVHGGAYNNQRYSALTQINRENVADLVPVWIYQTGISESFSTTPIVVGNIMYLSTPESRVVALNAATGEKLWEFIPSLAKTSLCCGPDNRGVAVQGDKVFVGTLDARMIALDSRTGEVRWETRLADPDDGYSQTVAPLAFDGKVLAALDGAEFGVRGFVVALDAESGEEVWRWYTIPAPGDVEGGWRGKGLVTDPFGTPLNRDLAFEQQAYERRPDREDWKRGGGVVETTPAYDPASNTLFLVVGNPAPSLDGSVRPGDNLFTGSVVALDGATGKMRWYTQYLPHDVWDLSGGSPPFLFESQGRTLLGHAGKTGWLYIFDAATGQPVLRSDNFVPQEALFTHPTQEGTRMLPGANGGSAWSPVAYSHRTGFAYVSGIHQPMVYRRAFQPREKGRLWLGGSFRHIPEEEQWGVLSAIDVSTGEIAWQRQVPAPMIGGTLVTAGDVLFVGQSTGTFDAFDARTGELLWQYRTGAGVNGSPITYMIDGVQYVAIAAGGNYLLDTPRGDDLIVFALGSQRPAMPLANYPEPRYARTGPIQYNAVRQVPASQVPNPDSAPLQ